MLPPATPGWVSVPVVVCGPPPLLAGVRWRRWCVVCGVWCVVCGVWCVVCGGGVLVGLRLVCGVVGSSPLPAEVPVRYSPPLLAGFRCRQWWAFLATPGGGSQARFPATPGGFRCRRWCVVCGVWCVACGVRRWRVWWVCGWCVVWLVPRHSWRRFLCATPRHSWLGFAAGGGVGLPATPGWGPPVVVVFFAGGGVLCCVCLWCVWVCVVAVLCCVLRVCGVCVFGGVVWWCGGCVFPSPWPWCVCVRCVALRVGVGGVGGGVVRPVAVVRARVCARGVWLVGWGVSYLGWFLSSVVGMFQKAEEGVL